MAANDIEARDALLAEDAIEVYPESGERFRGRANLRAIIEQYPGGEAMKPPAIDDLIGVEDRWVMTPAFSAMKVQAEARPTPSSIGSRTPTERNDTSSSSCESAEGVSGT